MIDNVLAMFSLLCFSAGHIAQTVVVAVVVVLAMSESYCGGDYYDRF